jgi:rfaE bifunctional protein kinase chain/domain
MKEQEVREKIKNLKVLVIGDIMLDQYVIGTVDRIAPEAPTPILNETRIEKKLGGCGNVISNLSELGVQVSLMTQLNLFEKGGKTISHLIAKSKIKEFLFLQDSKYPIKNTIKKRFITEDYKQVFRVDSEEIKSIMRYDHSNWNNVVKYILRFFENINKFDLIIISDYGKGMVSYGLIYFLNNYYRGKIFIDPKPKNLPLYKELNNIHILTPNNKEFLEMGNDIFNINYKCLIRTMGEDGVKLYYSNDKKPTDILTEKVKVFDVSGAGDTFISMLSILYLIQKYKYLNNLISIVNQLAGYVVQRPKTTTVPEDYFYEILQENFFIESEI